jgi:hypothetical protein
MAWRNRNAATQRLLDLIIGAEGRIRTLPEGRWPAEIAEERRRLEAAGESGWTTEHVAYCLEERLLRRHKQQGCGASAWGGHECVLNAAHVGRPHRCACGHTWTRT